MSIVVETHIAARLERFRVGPLYFRMGLAVGVTTFFELCDDVRDRERAIEDHRARLAGAACPLTPI